MPTVFEPHGSRLWQRSRCSAAGDTAPAVRALAGASDAVLTVLPLSERWARSGSFPLDHLGADKLRETLRGLGSSERTGTGGIHTLGVGAGIGMRWSEVLGLGASEPWLQASATGLGLLCWRRAPGAGRPLGRRPRI